MCAKPPVCHVCSDSATGKHYGALSCDGCKGFFRRSIRKRHAFVCRFNRNCDVSKNCRNSCRCCRLRKCIEAGMKAEAIQNERDTIGKRRRKNESDEENSLLQVLLRSERLCQQLRSSVIKSTHQAKEQGTTSKQKPAPCTQDLATLDDVTQSIHEQLVLLVEWAKSLPQFASLTLDDQVNLLKTSAAHLIVLSAAYRSMNNEDAVCLANNTLVTSRNANTVGDMNSMAKRIVDEIVCPMNSLSVDKSEYVTLKAILFFNPACRELCAKSTVAEARLNSVRSLESRCGHEPSRASLLLLLLPPIHSIAQQLIENVELASVFRLVELDSLMQELILHNQPSTIIQQLKTPFHPI